ncbi:hypothetical protein D3C77_506270 [compost metagenome]
MNHPAAQLTGVFYRLRAGTFVGQLADHQLQRVEGGDHRGAQAADGFGRGRAGKKGIAVADRFVEPVTRGAHDHRGQPTRPENGAHHCRNNNAQADFLGTGRGDVEHPERVIDYRQGDHRQGVAGQHQGVAVGRTQVQ